MINSRRVRGAGWLLASGLLLFLAFEVGRVWLIMPLPGSQHVEAVDLAHALHRARWIVRLLLAALVAWTAWGVLRNGRWWQRIAALLGFAVLGVVAWQANGPMSADVMFRQPTRLAFSADAAALPPEALVVGVALPMADGRVRARAYPIQVIGYHHQVRDTLTDTALMVTYCTVCRTGRVFSPLVGGEPDSFRLVGMDRWNALFEDARTGSWWRQATGEAVAGELAGQRLAEVPSRQMGWGAWKALHPESDVLLPDPEFAASYERLQAFADGTSTSLLTGRDRGSWRDKSWVVGVPAGGAARAFDWNELVARRVIRDEVGDVPVLVVLAGDSVTFHAFDARPGGTGEPLDLAATADRSRFRDRATGATWESSGLALDGPSAGTRLTALPAYQEFWHSWRTFHPATSVRGAPEGELPTARR
jgi:hypothetical protein